MRRFEYKAGLSAATFAAVLLSASSAWSATVELVTNGGFEDGFTGFTTEFANTTPSRPNGVQQASVITNGSAFGLEEFAGDSFLAVNGGNDLNTDPLLWSQDISVVAGTTYDFSVQVGTATPVVLGNLSVQFDGTEILEILAPAADNTYEQFTTSFTATSSGVFALSFFELSTGFGGNDYGLDDISLTFDDAGTAPTVPLPAGGVLLLAGLGGLAFMRRR